MKTYKIILMLLVSSTIFFSSCKKDEETTDTNTNTNTTTTVTESITATVDGVSWSAASVYESSYYGTITINGTASDGSVIGFGMPSSATTGKHDITSMWDSYKVAYYNTAGDYEYTENGSITITSITSDVVKGTFEAETSLGNITSGTFTAKL